MSISFSGLSSGIDTSAWVDSLVALRQAKVTKLEEEKEQVIMSQDVLNNIKSFFASFRSVLERVTDAKFGIVTMDLFAQNLATSSNVSVLTGSATHEAQEAKYDIQVDKLATATQASSNHNYMTTVIESQTATLGTKLGELGVRDGQIGVNVGGNNFKLLINDEDTIGTFIEKLRSIGVDANYNERTGVFTANIDANDINDSLTVHPDGKVGTGIVEAFHLSDSVGGYESGNLETSETDTVVETATGATKLAILGVGAGAVKIEANGAEYTFQITNNSTIDEFVNAMKSQGIDASFKDGLLRIVDAEITNDGGTNLISALGLEKKTNHNTQMSNGLNYTEVKTAGAGDRITEFVTNGAGTINVYDKSGNVLGSVTVTESTTFESLFDKLSDYGIKGRIEDGVVSFTSTNGNYASGGLMDKLGVGITTTTITQTSGAGVSSGGQVNYNTVHDETTTTYVTTTSTATSTSTAGAGMSSGSGVNHSTVTSQITTVYSTTTLSHTQTIAMNVTSSGVLTYSTVVPSSTTETIAVDITSSSGVHYTTLISGGSSGGGTGGTGGGGIVGGGTGDSGKISSMQSSSPVYVTNRDSGTGTIDKYVTPEIVVIDPTLLTAAISNYNIIGINDAATLAELAKIVNNGNNCAGKTFVLTNDIDIGSYTSWTPIGSNSSKVFSGTFDGQGHVVKNLTMTSLVSGCAGLFGNLNNASIKNLGIENCNININTNSTYSYTCVGALAACINDTTTNISNCYSTGNIKYINNNNNTNVYGCLNIGGLVGGSTSSYDGFKITSSFSSATVYGEGYYEVSTGGLVGGQVDVIFENCYTTGDVTAKSLNSENYSANAGGLSGKGCGIVNNCYTTGNISASGISAYAGGINGYTNSQLTITNCYTTGNIDAYATTRWEGSGDNYACAGGLFGRADVRLIKHCYTTGDITASYGESYAYSYAGGLLGCHLYDTENYSDEITISIIMSFTQGKASVIKSYYANAGAIIGGRSSIKINYSAVYYNSDKNTKDCGGYSGTQQGIVQGVAGSKFTQSYIQGIGFTDANGWMYTSAATPELKSQNLLNAKTTLKELLGNNCTVQTIVVQTSSGVQNVVISANDSIAEKLADAGFEVSVEDGKMLVSSKADNAILSVSQELTAALHLVAEYSGSSSEGGTTKAVELTSTSEIIYYDEHGNKYYLSKNIAFQHNISFANIGCSETNYITIQNGTTKTVLTISTSDYISYTAAADPVITRLEAVGIKTYITNGKVTFVGDDSHYILGMTADLRVALHMDSGQGYTVIPNSTGSSGNSGNSSGGSSGPILTSIYVSSSNSNLALSVVGVNTTNYITVKNGSTTSIVTISAASTVAQLTAELAKVGISTDVTNGKFTFSGDDTHYILGMTTNLKSALNLTENGAKGYTIRTVETTATKNATLASANSDVLLSAFGVSGTNFITVLNGTTTKTVNVDAGMTLQDLTSALAVSGIAVTASGGKLTFSGDDSHSIIGITTNLANALKVTAGSGKSYTTKTIKSTTTTATETTVNVTHSVQMTGDTKFSQIGLTSDGTFTGVSNGRKFTMTITKTDTVGEIVQELEDYGFNASVRGGKFYVDGAENTYLTGISNNVKTALGITANPGAGTSYVVTTHTTLTTTTIANENTVHVTTSVQMTGETKFSQLGMTSDGTIKGVHNGKAFTLNVTKSDTVDDIVNALSEYGITASVRGGKIYINGGDDAYITELSNGVKTALGITSGTTYTVTTIKTYGNTSATKGTLNKVTVTSAVTRDTALSELGVTAGEFNIYKDGVKYTALISSDETVGSFMDTLSKFGIEASIVNNGNTSTLRITGNGDAYIAKSSSNTNASNVVDKLLPVSNSSTTYDYAGELKTYTTVTTRNTATEETLLSAFDTPWGGTTLKNAGILSFDIDGESRNVTVTETDTFASLIDKLDDAGVEAALVGGKFIISNANNVSINTAASTSALVNPNAAIKLTRKNSIDNFTASDSPVLEYKTIVEEHTGSAASFADFDTKLGLLNISSGTISVYRNGVKATININSEQTFRDLRSQIASKFSDIDLKFEDGYLTLSCSDKKAEVDFGSTTDTSNFLAITGLRKDAEDRSKVQSARRLYGVNADSVLVDSGLFKNGDVKAGTFFVGEQKITIDDKTTISDVISQINSSETANATAYWDSINAELVIKSRTTGAALINIEAGTSNFTDIIGLTESEWNTDGSLKSTKLKVDSQKLGANAEFKINGTSFTSSSNTITSDVSRIKGVTIDLKGVSEGSVTLTIERDKETLANALSDVVDAYNELMENVDKEIAIGGTLHDQSMLRLLRNRLQNMMTSSSTGSQVFRNLNQIGICTKKATAGSISTEKINELSFDKEKFFKTLKSDEKAVKELIVGSKGNDGIFVKVEDLLENALRSVTGYFDSTANSMKNKEKRIENKIIKGNAAIEKYRAKLETKFSAMDMLIGKMQQQYSSFLGG